MASIPVAGYPSGGFGAPNTGGRVLKLTGVQEMMNAMFEAEVAVEAVMRPALLEIGLFGERETKIRTPVQFGILRASIGHFDPSEMKTPTGGAKAPAGMKIPHPNPADAHFATHVVPSSKTYSVEWGTNVEYAPYIEDGFTMATRRLVFIWGVGFRWVNPFSYRGAHMFELALGKVEEVAPNILTHWLNEALKLKGLA